MMKNVWDVWVCPYCERKIEIGDEHECGGMWYSKLEEKGEQIGHEIMQELDEEGGYTNEEIVYILEETLRTLKAKIEELDGEDLLF